jgi:hypothetical protein
MRFHIMIAFGLPLLVICGSAAAEAGLCNELALQAMAKESGKPPKDEPPVRELCFPGQQSCVDHGGVPAQSIWENAPNPQEVKNVLLESADWIGNVSEASMPGKQGKLVRIARFVGSAHCVRDTYFSYHDGKYRLLHSALLDQLSAEAANCGDVDITLKQVDGPLLVSMLYGVATAYRFDQDFEPYAVCSMRYRAPRSIPQ